MPRPPVDVVVAYGGGPLGPVARLGLAPGDSLVIADNRRRSARGERRRDAGGMAWPAGARVVDARRRRGSYFARNRGAEAGSNPWLLFLDADVEPPADLLDRLLGAPVGERCGAVGGEVVDEPAGPGAPLAARYAHAAGLMSQRRTLERPELAYLQTSCCAVRRTAFAAVGGFDEHARSGGDADLCLRLRAAGWTLELRPEAEVVHRSRATLRRLLAQRLRVGAGAGWVDERHPGFAPRRPLGRAIAGGLRRSARGARALARDRGDDRAVIDLVEGLSTAVFEVGRRLPNAAR